ncbi:DUF5994 family protein [Nocardia vaccinii]|uniref:DUF5994 family protein n=1 Tax=Nocardia vaccinii TaxID=1822 RepID=UPI00082B9FCA|nr:DUF5994 family protein [Nocardia vaccinii]
MTAGEPNPGPGSAGRGVGPLRVRIDAEPTHTGWFDGTWPYGENLTAELPPLLAVLASPVEAVHGVISQLGDWACRPAFDNDRDTL